MSELAYLEIAELAALLERRDVSPVEATQAMLDRIAETDSALRSYVAVTADAAMDAARQAEIDICAGRYRGPLHGIPIGVKDLFWTEGVTTAGGMAAYRSFRPHRDATAVARLRGAGAIILGKLATTEGAYSDYHPEVVPPVNPWNSDYWAGISSSGPAVALAAGLCYGALATDTGGSIRWPCGATGSTGIKPTWGRVSRDGCFALAPTMDHVGTMARSAVDSGLLLAAIAGPDPRDPTALQEPFGTRGDLSLDKIKIGIDAAWNEADADPAVRNAVTAARDVFRDLGATIVEIAVPSTQGAVADWPDLCAIEAAVVHADTYPRLADEYGPVLAAVLERGRALSVMDHRRLSFRRDALSGAFDALFGQVDALLCPVQPFAPLTLSALGIMGAQPGLIARLQRFTCPFDMTGTPTITLPCGCDATGMPIGIQLAGGRLREAMLIGLGSAFQRATSWHRRRPECRAVPGA